ncbi:uncharacterized protein N7446_006673 [Penicillium canescens]|uniref:BTB domain-containing protein n=1 Tax=Penicillium canescens TaxID=5083 RepID=A0AAD6NCP9_PENCN|nr:uncharacterized protein N7446_006673 [Penicillium canescens]KAJ6052034.1 hypothetical protein N7460_002568 [Penicillium canescens]KAJ6062553.1 hypothetical protein N7446_006673 [Penicillium canescens]
MGGTQDATFRDAQGLELELQLPRSLGLTSAPPCSFLTSPVVEIVVGEGGNQTVLTAHQTLLLESPLLATLVEKFEVSGPRRIKLPEEDVDAFGLFFTFPIHARLQRPQHESSTDPAVGDGSKNLLRHARVYTLADKLGLQALKSLAHSKIHKVKSSSHAEYLYARYVYTNIPAPDTTIRKPVASYWASHSHTLRREIDDDFKKLCIEVPEFSFDVLTIILDRKDKQIPSDEIKGSARKRRSDL